MESAAPRFSIQTFQHGIFSLTVVSRNLAVELSLLHRPGELGYFDARCERRLMRKSVATRLLHSQRLYCGRARTRVLAANGCGASTVAAAVL
jgi:hypothetical protein